MDVNNEYGLLDLHRCLINLLDVFHKKCVQNGIRYSLGYGSLLGAIRHDGIIPWDDDIDVIISRENYLRLVKVFENDEVFLLERNNSKTLWIDRVRFKNSRDYLYAPTIDLFVIDNVPNNALIANTKLYLILFLQGMIKLKFFQDKGNLIERIASFIASLLGVIFPLKVKLYFYRKISSIGNSHKTVKVANYNVEYLYVRRKYNQCLLDCISERRFESICVFTTDSYDSYLSTLYGDYMTPPKDKTPKHIKN